MGEQKICFYNASLPRDSIFQKVVVLRIFLYLVLKQKKHALDFGSSSLDSCCKLVP